MSNLFALNLAEMCGNIFFGLRGQFQQINELRLRNSSSKHISPWKSQFTNASPNFPMHEGVLLIPFNYKTGTDAAGERETVIKLICTGITIINRTDLW
jgi:hypothetical protein